MTDLLSCDVDYTYTHISLCGKYFTRPGPLAQALAPPLGVLVGGRVVRGTTSEKGDGLNLGACALHTFSMGS